MMHVTYHHLIHRKRFWATRSLALNTVPVRRRSQAVSAPVGPRTEPLISDICDIAASGVRGRVNTTRKCQHERFKCYNYASDGPGSLLSSLTITKTKTINSAKFRKLASIVLDLFSKLHKTTPRIWPPSFRNEASYLKYKTIFFCKHGWSMSSPNMVQFGSRNLRSVHKYKYNSYFYCAPYSLTEGALQKSANTCFTAVGRLK